MRNPHYDGPCCICGRDLTASASDSHLIDFEDAQKRIGPVLMCDSCYRSWPLGEGWRSFARRSTKAS